MMHIMYPTTFTIVNETWVNMGWKCCGYNMG